VGVLVDNKFGPHLIMSNKLGGAQPPPPPPREERRRELAARLGCRASTANLIIF
jgi:hypothetical protein